MLPVYALAEPVASSANNSTSFDSVMDECIDINGCRTTTGILWSCLSVIFICTWVAIHPNIPIVQDRRGNPWHPAVLVYQDIELMVIALLAPEFMILWAMRQREQAKRICDEFKEYKWGMSHGFFVVMGGFALYNGEKFCGYLWDRDLRLETVYGMPFDGDAEEHFGDIKTYHERHRKVELEYTARYLFSYQAMPPSDILNPHNEKIPVSSTPSDSHKNSPTNTAQHIDPSSDRQTPLKFLVSKGYITITEGEINDRSHADVITKSIAIIQTTWFILQVIARAVEGLAITELEIITVGFAILNFGTYFLWWNKPLRVRHPVRVYWRQTERSVGGNTDGGKGGIWRTCWEGANATVEYIYAPHTLFIGGRRSDIFIRVFLLPLFIPLHIFVVCFKILRDHDDIILAIPIASRLGYGPSHISIAVYGIAALFGVIHSIPWHFHFPTHTEQVLWRISAISIAMAPVGMGILHGYSKSKPRIPNRVAIHFAVAISLTYAFFRVTLLFIAFTALRDLSPSAYQTVQWTTFWPHIG